jgi:hypothetical protein
MSQFHFELATPSDDAELRRVLGHTPMGGRVQLTFRREPSFFDAAVVDGPNVQVGVCRDSQTKRLVGFGVRSFRQRFVNGQPQVVGYLSGLRLLAEFRNHGLVARGYRFFRRMHEHNHVPCYLTTIAEGNEAAMRVLTSGRAGLPPYYDLGRFHTAALGSRRISTRSMEGVTIAPATVDDREELINFLQREGRHRQFFPCYENADFFHPGCTMKDLKPEHILIARRNGTIVGTLAAWDQSNFKQTIVEGYAGSLGWLRRIVNPLGKLTGRPAWPRPGDAVQFVTAALPLVQDDDEEVFAALVANVLQREAATKYGSLMIGLHERDPLIKVLRQFQPRWFTTRLYVVCFEDGESFRQQIDNRVPYLELGCL